MRKAKQFTVRLAARQGVLGELAAALWGKGVHIRAFLADVHGHPGSVHLVVDNPAAARQAFVECGSRARGHTSQTLAQPSARRTV